MEIIEAAPVPKGFPVTFHGMCGQIPVAVAAVLRPLSGTPGRWMVWPDDSRMIHLYHPRSYRGEMSRRALDGPMYGFDAARRYPEHARVIAERPDSSD